MKFVAVFVVALLIAFVDAGIVMWMWNAICTDVLNKAPISFGSSLCLVIMVKTLTSQNKIKMGDEK